YAGVLEIETGLLPRFGIQSTLVENADLEAYRRALRPNTRLILVETPANPTLAVTSLRGVAALARGRKIRTVADNPLATPSNQNPIRLGLETAMGVARLLHRRPAVKQVYYPGLASHPGHREAKRQMRGFGGLLSFELKGGYRAGVRLVESVKVITLAVSLGGVETLIQHPA